MQHKHLILIFFLAASPICWAVDRPNVLFISVDDLNDFPTFCGRYPDAKTPHMDQLAKRGMVFTNAHCQFPLCGPSRASIMSGLLPSTLGYDNHMRDEALEKRAHQLQTELLHSYYSNHGYKTLAVGKICHNHVPRGSVAASGGRGGFASPTGKLMKNWPQQGTSTDWAIAEARDEDFPDHQAADWAIKQLQAEHQKPFLLMVGFLRPHVPWYVTKKWFDLYPEELTLPTYNKDDLDDVPEIAKEIIILKQMPRTDWAIENNQWQNIVRAYLACISFTDHQVGRVLKALAASPYADNTIIVLWSDHGYHLGEKNTFQKQSLWQRSSHVPLVIVAPKVNAGRCDRVVSLLDLYPTLLEMCDLPKNPHNEGHSLVPLLHNPRENWPYPAITGWKENSFALQNQRYRYIQYGDGSEELYDHQIDLNELKNLARDPNYQEVKSKLADHLSSLLKKKVSD